MSRRTTASLVVVLLFASVAPAAHSAPTGSFFDAPDLFARAWSFLERFWAPAVTPGEPGERPGGARAIWANGGACIDPDGRPAGAGCAGVQVFWTEGGGCIDPNGSPAAAGCTDLLGPEH